MDDDRAAAGFVKEWRCTLESSVFTLPDSVYRTWRAMNLLADEAGFVTMLLPTLAGRLQRTTTEILADLEILMAPDPDSRDGRADGRRLIEAPGGWLIVNYVEMRDCRVPRKAQEAERKRRHRKRARAEAAMLAFADGRNSGHDGRNSGGRWRNSGHDGQMSRKADADVSPQTVPGLPHTTSAIAAESAAIADIVTICGGAFADATGAKAAKRPRSTEFKLTTPLPPVGRNADRERGRGGEGEVKTNTPNAPIARRPVSLTQNREKAPMAAQAAVAGRPATPAPETPQKADTTEPRKPQAQKSPALPRLFGPADDDDHEVMREVHEHDDRIHEQNRLAAYHALVATQQEYLRENANAGASRGTVPYSPNDAECRTFEAITQRGDTDHMLRVMRWVWGRLDAGIPPGVLAEKPGYTSKIFSGSGKIYAGLASDFDAEQTRRKTNERRHARPTEPESTEVPIADDERDKIVADFMSGRPLA